MGFKGEEQILLQNAGRDSIEQNSAVTAQGMQTVHGCRFRHEQRVASFRYSFKEGFFAAGANRNVSSEGDKKTGEILPYAAVTQHSHGGVLQNAVDELHGGHKSGFGGDVGVAKLEQLIVVIVDHASRGGDSGRKLSTEQHKAWGTCQKAQQLVKGHGTGWIAGTMDSLSITGGRQGEDDGRGILGCFGEGGIAMWNYGAALSLIMLIIIGLTSFFGGDKEDINR